MNQRAATGAVVKGQRSGPPEDRIQGHWLLAQLGKRVLRPGGVALTKRLITRAAPSGADRVVEFGPGVGSTAQVLLRVNPKRYVGVDPSPEPASAFKRVIAGYANAERIVASAQDTGLPDACADLVVGEAMLTMQSDVEKLEIMREAHRILAPGGRYAVHELGFKDSASEATRRLVAKTLSRTIKVGARPLTSQAWIALLNEAGFEVRYRATNAMRLLEPKRIIADEGVRGAARFFFNVARNAPARARLLRMRNVFRENADALSAVGFVAVKPER